MNKRPKKVEENCKVYSSTRLGWAKNLGILAMILAVGCGGMMFEFQDSPAQAWDRIVTTARKLLLPATEPAPTPTLPTPLPTPTPTPKPVVVIVTPAPTPKHVPVVILPTITDAPVVKPTPPNPLKWLAAHKGLWPLEVQIKSDTSFPVVAEGKVAGSAILPAGSLVKLLDIDLADHRVTLVCSSFGGGQEQLPIDSTDLDVRARAALALSFLPSPTPSAVPLATSVKLGEKSSSLGQYGIPTLSVMVSNPAAPLINQPIVVLGKEGTVVLLTAVAAGFRPMTYNWTQVQDIANSFATTGTAEFSTNQTTQPTVKVQMPSAGIYEFQVTAAEGDITVNRYVWVNVWDSKTAIGPNNIGRNPGVDPPTSVRVLSEDPGPFCHPRLFFTRSDWAELSAKSTLSGNVPESRIAVEHLKASLERNFDKAGSPMDNLRVALRAYAESGYSDTVYKAICSANNLGSPETASPKSVVLPDLFRESTMASYPESNFSDALGVACYLAWLDVNPNRADAGSVQVERLKDLATLTAAYAKVRLAMNLSFPDGELACFNLALCYDLTYDWMTSQQQSVTRDYLYTIGNKYNTGGGGSSINKNPNVPSSTEQNGGDFPNLNDGFVLPALAIEGEESQVSPALLNDHARFGTYLAAANDNLDKNVTPTTSWPNASDRSVRNLERELRGNSEYTVSPWGFELNMFAYWQLGQNVSAVSCYALSRRGENQWVTTNLYQASLHALYNLAPKESDGMMTISDHQDSSGFANGSGERNEIYLAKYMYPDDPMVDYVYRQAVAGWGRNQLTRAIFGAPLLDLKLNEVAQAKHLTLTKLDPLIGFAISRNGWNDDDLNLVFQNFTLGWGHYHAEANTFALYALGRTWTCPPGYHIVDGDAQAQVLIQLKVHKPDPITNGYIGEGPSCYNYSSSGGPFHGALLDVQEDPNKLWTWFVGDAKPTYDYVSAGVNAGLVPTHLELKNLVFPGLLSCLIPTDAQAIQNNQIPTHRLSNGIGTAMGLPYNPVQYAFRSILTVRGKTPYVLVIDDINKDKTPNNYRWTMNCCIGFGPSNFLFVNKNREQVASSLEINPESTSTEAVLYHDIDSGSASGLPRLLVRDVSGQPADTQPKIILEDRTNNDLADRLNYGIDNNSHKFSTFPTRRLFIDRNNVIEPKYKILLFPYLIGANLPTTSWNPGHTILTVQTDDSIDEIKFDDSNPDHRTRLQGFHRTIK